ncbi:37S ribosomal protein S10 mitochondrial [Dissostichus eleginoides]|uniref:37S ribosomal protein S10 mitochondrial n=1 Tax=Dissostichus eleginoides TaxID=100907 RepID=A0AAD9B800_DISEL|nr:37S ribosomal protein S10 mitochondrial [Dissostichus eleginoides]
MERRGFQPNRGKPVDLVELACKQIHCSNGQISNLTELYAEYHRERNNFCHRVRAEKEKVKRLDDLLDYRDTGFSEEHIKQFDTIMEREEDISYLRESLCQQSQQQTSDSQQHGGLLQAKTETARMLMRKGEDLLQFITILEDKCSAEKEKMEAESQHRQQLDEMITRFEAEKKISDQINKETSDSLDKEKLLRLEAENTNAELRQSVTAWQLDCSCLQEQVLKEVALKQSREAEVQQLVARSKGQEEIFFKHLAENHQRWIRRRKNWENSKSDLQNARNGEEKDGGT